MGYRQTVRHWTLTPAFQGSNPCSPVLYLQAVDFTACFFIHYIFLVRKIVLWYNHIYCIISCGIDRGMEEFMIKENFIKKPGVVLLATSLVIGGMVYAPTVTQAADEVSLVRDSNVATANTEIPYDFAVADSNTVYIDLVVPEMVSGMLSFYKNDEYDSNVTLTSDANTWKYFEDEYGAAYIHTLAMKNPVSADWTVSLNFDTDTAYVLSVSQEKASATINKNTLTLTSGFSEKLSVQGADGTVKWKSSNNKVATVSSDGNVTSKKAGSAKITATTESGQVLTCAVSVQKNVYNENRQYPTAVQYGTSAVQVYKMSYDKNGNLVLKASVLNNRGQRSAGIKKLTITVTNEKNKKIGVFTLSNKRFSLNSGDSKDFTFKINKSDLKIKKADLRTASYKTKGTILYVR